MKVIGYLNDVQSMILNKPNLIHLVNEEKWEEKMCECCASICAANNVPVIYGTTKEVDKYLNKLCDFEQDINDNDYSRVMVSSDYEIYSDFFKALNNNNLEFKNVSTPAFIITNGEETGFIVSWGYTWPRFKGRIDHKSEEEVQRLITATRTC